jgi:gas vesicle protein
MTNRNDILNELKELGSKLADAPLQNTYSVPEGYFEGFASQVLARIKAMDAADAKEELNSLSPYLNNLSRELPYKTPAGYFDGLEERMMNAVRASADYQTADEELEGLSPLLKGLKKENPYKVPQGYFENFSMPAVETAGTKVVSMASRKLFRYAAAAVVIGIVAISGMLFLNPGGKVDPNKDSHAWVEKNVKKVSSDKLDEFINLTEKEKSFDGAVAAADKSEEIKELLKDLTDDEIQDLLKDTEVLDDSGTDDILMN